MNTPTASTPHVSDETLNRMRNRADPVADDTIARILSPWQPVSPDTSSAAFDTQWQPQWANLNDVTTVFADWITNAALRGWQAQSDLPAAIGVALAAYTSAARIEPDWADANKILLAEKMFTDYGALSVTLLFCASLPECYVVPDLASVLQMTGQLEDNVDYRIRATGAMIFPVMAVGGLTAPDGGGVAQVFKVRLIHATIRNLILRGNPSNITAMQTADSSTADAAARGELAALPQLQAARAQNGLRHDEMHQALFANGWSVRKGGMPCDQEELAYTLLTFSYVYLRAMRKLGQRFSKNEEEAYLHAWNVMGYYLGIERTLMVDTMDEAEALFGKMQERGRAEWQQRTRDQPTQNQPSNDPRPALGTALMKAMADVIPWRVFKPFPELMTRYLCGPESSRDLGLNQRVSWYSRALFRSVMLSVRAFDALIRLVFRDFSISRLITRVLGHKLITALLMRETRNLKLPGHLRDGINTALAGFGNDNKAPAWLNAVEDWMTIKGGWHARPPV